jgi:mRNA interferase RelE/StbE
VSPYDIQVSGPAIRALGRLPPKIQEVVVAFVYEELADSPQLRGRPLAIGASSIESTMNYVW